MKKFLIIIVAIAIILCFVGCNKDKGDTNPTVSSSAGEKEHGRASDYSKGYKIEDSGEAVTDDNGEKATSEIRDDTDMNP